ncbi:hypothetical protein AHAS_Ahas15G0160700 [Arachis hypogaea]
MSPSEKEITASVRRIAVTVDSARRRCVERRAKGRARDRRGRESYRRVCCRLTIIAIVEPRGDSQRCELAKGEREPANLLLSHR